MLTPIILSAAKLGEIEANVDRRLQIAVSRHPFRIDFITDNARDAQRPIGKHMGSRREEIRPARQR